MRVLPRAEEAMKCEGVARSRRRFHGAGETLRPEKTAVTV
jgi:hypothetical protein